LALAVALGGWVTHSIIPVVILVMSVAAVGYFLFQAPLWCGSATRDGTLCRNNSLGLVIGCHLRQHKWQKLKMTVVPNKWRELNRGLWVSPRQGVTTLSGVASVVSVLVSMVAISVR
jgi:hypothetical protein